MRIEKKMMTVSLPFLFMLILVLAPLLTVAGCGGGMNFSSGNTVSSDAAALTPTESPLPLPSPTDLPITFFRAYVYAPVTPRVSMIDTGNWPSAAGLVTLLSSEAPNGYTAVQGAHVFPENNPSHVITTDSRGMFTIDFRKESSLNNDGGLPLIIRPMDNFARFTAIKTDVYPMTTGSGMGAICLHTSSGDMVVGSVAQIYVKGTMGCGFVKILDPSLISWNNNSELISVSPHGIISGLKAGKAVFPVNVGNMNCEVNFNVRDISTPFCTLTGVVTDSAGNAVSGAVISTSGRDTVAITGTFGSYSLPGLPQGEDLQITVGIHGKVCYTSRITMNFNTMLNINIPDMKAEEKPMAEFMNSGDTHRSLLYNQLQCRGRITSI